MKRQIIIIAGPTAVGKTKYSIEIAKRFDGEIVSADSMQIYKYMDIGSAKPTAEELSQARHHLVDEIDPRTFFTVAEYRNHAKDAIKDIFSRNKTVIISGGTGLYINSLIYDMDFSAPPREQDFRKKLEEIADTQGSEYLHQMLSEADKQAAERIHPNNTKKIIRALEICDSTGKATRPFEESFVKTSDYDVLLIGLCRQREELYDRINRRVDILLEKGLVDEIKRLIEMGLTEENISMKGIGYKELLAYFHGKYDMEEAIRLIKQNSRRYAKRQMTWFRRYNDINWFNLSEYDSDESATEDIALWLKKNI